MNAHFDLIGEPWLPCIRMDGTPVELGLLNTLVQAHTLRELNGETPLSTAALHRLLLAVLHRVVDGPRSPKAWGRLWQAGRWDETAVRAYLERWRDRFDLFDDAHPFYQAADARVKPKPLNSLMHRVASGNNSTLFDHHTDDRGVTLTTAEAARTLVTAQAFGLAGLSGLTQKYTDGACASGAVFIVLGSNLFETLALNLVRYAGNEPMPREPDDCPAWEMDDPFAPERAVPLGYLDYLTWHNRRVLFFPPDPADSDSIQRMTMAPALRLDSSVENPMVHYRKDDKRGAIPMAFYEGKVLWRDSAALFELHHQALSPPRVFYWLAELVDAGSLPRAATYRYLALGISKKQAKVYFARQEQFPLHLTLLLDDEQGQALLEALRRALAAAERIGGALREAGRELACWIVSPTDKNRAHGDDVKGIVGQLGLDRRYWPCLEVPFRAFVRDLPGDRHAALQDWIDVSCKAARRAFDQAADGVAGPVRGLKAVTRARDTLERRIGRILNPK
jgi:CRISPR system Cascade subunit CasA